MAGARSSSDGLVQRLRPGLRVQHLGDERLVLDPSSGVLHSVRGAAVPALDRILAGRTADDDELLSALVAAGIVEAPELTRRQALALSTSAVALIASSVLPSALAAASTASFTSSGESGTVIEYTLSSPAGARLYRLSNLELSYADTTYRLIAGGTTTIDVLLVAGGGAGGAPGNSESVAFFGGGGGGGEVALVTVASAPAGTQFDFVVAGSSSGIGRDTSMVVGADSVVASGGGRGASRIVSTLTPASDGGSGGGGTSRSGATTGGFGVEGGAVGLSRTRAAVSDGGTATVGHAGGAGGGGADANGAPSGLTAGGNGGAGVTLSDYTGWNLTVTSGADPASAQVVFGSGGGGASTGTRGTSDAGGLAGRGGGRTEEGDAASGRAGPVASGAGGGGGIRFLEGAQYVSASAGDGGSGVVWVRVRPS